MMETRKTPAIKHPQVGVCGLSCVLCPRYHTSGESRCHGCKTESRMAAGCPFITCALKKKGIEFCWECAECDSCLKWKRHRELGKEYDSFKCYQSLEKDIAFIREHGVDAFEEEQSKKAELLQEILRDYDDGRSKSYFCIAATVISIEELRNAIDEANKESAGVGLKEKNKALRTLLDEYAAKRGIALQLRRA